MFKLIPEQLGKALQELDEWLDSHGKRIEITLVGAIAVSNYTNEGRFTQDIDTVGKIDDETVLEQIKNLADKHGLTSEWLSDRASTVTLPDEFFKRTKKIHSGKAIEVYVAERQDLIALKAAAYVNRGSEVMKDLEDLMHLKVTHKEIQVAIDFVRKKCSPPIDKNPWRAHFEESLEVLRELAK